ncbi:MAG: hypothetical protein LBB74_06860 [Chitinispirillales bacterium]|jgi:hypothetical protein|nr:hypothetical protein [Chitinispirillales bacterium]
MPKISVAPIALACAAAFTFAVAQDSSSEYPGFESYDIGPYSAGGESGSGETSSSSEDAVGDEGAKKKTAEKQSGERKERSARGKRSGPSFSSAFSGPQKSCPVCSSVRLKNNLYVDCSGGRIHVCGAACIDRVRRNPAAFSEILLKRGEQLATP